MYLAYAYTTPAELYSKLGRIDPRDARGWVHILGPLRYLELAVGAARTYIPCPFEKPLRVGYALDGFASDICRCEADSKTNVICGKRIRLFAQLMV